MQGTAICGGFSGMRGVLLSQIHVWQGGCCVENPCLARYGHPAKSVFGKVFAAHANPCLMRYLQLFCIMQQTVFLSYPSASISVRTTHGCRIFQPLRYLKLPVLLLIHNLSSFEVNSGKFLEVCSNLWQKSHEIIAKLDKFCRGLRTSYGDHCKAR